VVRSILCVIVGIRSDRQCQMAGSGRSPKIGRRSQFDPKWTVRQYAQTAVKRYNQSLIYIVLNGTDCRPSVIELSYSRVGFQLGGHKIY